MNNLAGLLSARGQFARACQLYEKCREPLRRRYGAEHVVTLAMDSDYGVCLNGLGRSADAEALFARLLPVEPRVLGPESPGTQLCLYHLALALQKQGKFDGAERALRDLLPVWRKVLPAGHWQVGGAELLLGMCLVGQKHFAEAVPVLLAAHDHLVRARNPPAPGGAVRDAVAALVGLYDAWGKPDRAAAWRARGAARNAPKPAPPSEPRP
jgi:hypothetical protein